MQAPLSEHFLLRVADPMRVVFEERSDLDRTLEELCDNARETWPSVTLDPLMFVSYVADRLPEDGKADAIDSVHASDLYLACGCALGDAAAITAFEKAFLPELDIALASLDKSGTMTEEVKQRMREKLFVAEADDLPKIAEFTGRGSLKAWLKVAAMRTALNMRRKTKREVRLSAEHIPAMVEDVELGHLKKTYREEFKQAFSHALTQLSPRQRSLLKLHTIDGLNIDQLGSLHKVHRTTAARWLREAREALASQTKKSLRQNLKIDQQELESIMRLIRSRIDLSVRRFLDD